MKIFNWFYLYLLTHLLGCASHPPPLQYGPANGLLFPDAKYQQQVQIKIEIPEKNIKEDFNFKAAIKRDSTHFIMLAYNSLGFSLFRLEDKPPTPLLWNTEIELLNKNKKFFLDLYPQLKKLFNLEGRQLSRLKDYYIWKDDKYLINFLSFDHSGRPLKIKIIDNVHYWVDIENIYPNLE
jgi:hypothetical protein